MQRKRFAVALAMICLAGCGSSSERAEPPSTTTVPRSTAAPRSTSAAQYLADVAPFNAAASALPAHAQVTAPSMIAFGRAGLTFARKLLAQSWPTTDEGDVHALAADVKRLAADISTKNTNALTHDAASANAEAQTLRKQLGLPPDPS
jgi:hypothetical protein